METYSIVLHIALDKMLLRHIFLILSWIAIAFAIFKSFLSSSIRICLLANHSRQVDALCWNFINFIRFFFFGNKLIIWFNAYISNQINTSFRWFAIIDGASFILCCLSIGTHEIEWDELHSIYIYLYTYVWFQFNCYVCSKTCPVSPPPWLCSQTLIILRKNSYVQALPFQFYFFLFVLRIRCW